jgi:hypothetical protein
MISYWSTRQPPVAEFLGIEKISGVNVIVTGNVSLWSQFFHPQIRSVSLIPLNFLA